MVPKVVKSAAVDEVSELKANVTKKVSCAQYARKIRAFIKKVKLNKKYKAASKAQRRAFWKKLVAKV